MPVIELTTKINAPIEICFDLSRSIDLHKLSIEGTREEAIAGVTSGLIGLNEEVTWRATHFGVRQTLSSKITKFNYPYHFRDEMLKGAFKKIEHDHYFEKVEGGTIMKDRFEFESPGGILGTLFNKLVLTSYLYKVIYKRNEFIKRMAESGKWKAILKVSNYQEV